MRSRHDPFPLILVISDGVARAQRLSEPLSHEGYRVVVTAHRNALVRQVGSMDPHLLLLDLEREIDPTTRALLQALRARPEPPPAILLCLDESATLEEVNDRDLERVQILAAPWEVDELLEQVHRALHEQPLYAL